MEVTAHKALLAVGAIGVAGLGFLLGGQIAGDSPDSAETLPKPIVTQDSHTHIRTLGGAAAIPALATPQESTSEAPAASTTQTSEYSPSEGEYSPTPETEEKTPQSSSPSPEITVAPNE